MLFHETCLNIGIFAFLYRRISLNPAVLKYVNRTKHQQMTKLYAIASTFILIGGISLIEANSSGAPAGHSGSPASNGQTCARSGCHSGGGAPGVQHQVMVSSDIPATGYVAGTTYNFTVSVDDANDMAARAGLSLSIENGSGVHVGTLATGNGTRFSPGSTAFITQQSSAVSLPSAGRDYTFQWTAPSSGTGQVTLYAAVNFANGNGNTSGDIIKTISEAIDEASSVGLYDGDELSFQAYPNPTQGMLYLPQVPTKAVAWSITDIQGRCMEKGELVPGGSQEWKLSDYPAGLYFLNYYGDEGHLNTQRIVKN